LIGVMAVGRDFFSSLKSGPGCPGLPKLAVVMGRAPISRWGWLGGDGDRGLGALWGRKSGPDLPPNGGAKRYRGAKKKNIYFWLTASLIARCLSS
jgi:hypothetical protein